MRTVTVPKNRILYTYAGILLGHRDYARRALVAGDKFRHRFWNNQARRVLGKMRRVRDAQV